MSAQVSSLVVYRGGLVGPWRICISCLTVHRHDDAQILKLLDHHLSKRNGQAAAYPLCHWNQTTCVIQNQTKRHRESSQTYRNKMGRQLAYLIFSVLLQGVC